MNTLNINQYSASMQAGMGVILNPILKKMNINLNIGTLCETIGIGRTSAYEAVKDLEWRLLLKDDAENKQIQELEDSKKKLEIKNNEQKFIIEFLTYQLEHPDSLIIGEYQSYTAEFKEFIYELKGEYDFTLTKISELTGIPEDSLKKFQRIKKSVIPKNAPEKLPENIKRLINEYLRSGKGCKTVKQFINNNPDISKELNMTYPQIAAWLNKLGFVNLNRIFLPNTGLDRIIRFTPNIVWGSDGKEMKITINGKTFKWVWQCLIDFKTTVIVGGLVGAEETTDNLLEAIKKSGEKTGIVPLAIVIDNRLSENLPAIREYLDKFDIKIINTFPGNPKSAAIVEGNFSIFERWVGGDITIDGDNPEELSRSIAQMVVEIFTQLRNHKPRTKSKGNKTPSEIMNNYPPPSEKEIQSMKEKIDEFAERLKKDQAKPEISIRKKNAIDLAVKLVKPKDGETFIKRLSPSCYTFQLILSAISIFETCKKEKPEENYNHTYFGGILRNLVNQERVECINTHLDDIFFHQFEDLLKKNENELLLSLHTDPFGTCKDLALDFLKMPVPAWGNRILLQLKELFFIASKGCFNTAKELCKNLTNQVVNWTFQAKKQRELLLLKLYEWTSYIQIYEKA